MQRLLPSNVRIHVIIAIALLLVFTIDLVIPLGYAGWLLYLVPAILTLAQRVPSVPIMVAGITTLFMAVGFVFSPSVAISFSVALVNRILGVFCLWGVALIVRQVVTARGQVERDNWLRVAQTRINELVRGEVNAREIGNRILKFLAEYTNAKVGTFYLLEGHQTYRRVATYALSEPSENEHDLVRVGEGLLGQVAKDQEMISLEPLPESYLKVKSGLGETLPKVVLVSPFVIENETKGIIELGFLTSPNERVLELLNRLSEPIAVSIRSLQFRIRLQELLEEAQRQAEELQAQQEELKVSNEELVEQTRLLREAQVRLESQQSELEESNSQLENQAQLLEQQKETLERSKKEVERVARELQAASQYKSEFLANMSHELRTPLNSTLILAKLLLENRHSNLNDEQLKYLNTIYDSGHDLLALINDILDLSKVEAGMLDIHPEFFHVSEFIEDIKKSFEPLSMSKGLKFEVNVDPGVPAKIKTDRKRVEQIIRNLLSNAFKFTHQGEVRFRISRVSDGSDSSKIAMTVIDTGIGIPKDKQDVIFEAFRQADGTTNRKYGGTGLGLSISKDLATLLKGQIKVESTPGKGSSFSLIIPEQLNDTPHPAPDNGKFFNENTLNGMSGLSAKLSQTVQEEKEATSKPAPKVQKNKKNGQQKKTILIVEDEEAFADVLTKIASERNFECLRAKSASEGFEMAASQQPQAILLDIRLPDNFGLGLLDRLKSDSRTRHIPVHVVTSHDFKQSALQMGAMGYALKSAKHEELQQVFKRLESHLSREVKRVLIVEDDVVQSEGILKLIENEEVKPDIARNGKEALDKVRSVNYDCVILDLNLNDMSGFEVLESMAEMGKAQTPPVIVYTARSLTREEEDRLRRYSQRIIVKGAMSPERLLSEVTLFLHHVESKLPPEQQMMLRKQRDNEKTFQGRKIMIVEDDIRSIFSLSAVLEGRGAHVEIARNGVEALGKLDKAEAGSIDLILMDIMMPEMDGYQAIREIRKNPKWSKIPIIAVTAKAMRDDYEKCLRVGANDYLPKPIDLDRLVSLSRVWLPPEGMSARN